MLMYNEHGEGHVDEIARWHGNVEEKFVQEAIDEEYIDENLVVKDLVMTTL